MGAPRCTPGILLRCALDMHFHMQRLLVPCQACKYGGAFLGMALMRPLTAEELTYQGCQLFGELVMQVVRALRE